ncbi:MAG: SH3 domain-containing protein, partial [Rhodospirillaceae bacterium]|nr:SH3 domain-containing protein [Rhodospirillaceae bacterium]
TEVAKLTNNKQKPWINSSVTGDFIFNPTGTTKATAPPAPAVRAVPADSGGSAAELLFWDTIKDSKLAADFRDYLGRFPNGPFASLARRRIESLKLAALPPPFSVEELEESYIVLKTANVRAAPTTTAVKLGRLELGAAVEVTGKTQVRGREWWRIALAEGRIGYVWGPLLGEAPTLAKSPEKPSPKPIVVSSRTPAPTAPTEPPLKIDARKLLAEAHDELIGVLDTKTGYGMTALRAIAQAEAALGHIEAATKQAMAIRHERLRRETLIAIANELLAAGDYRGAMSYLARRQKHMYIGQAKSHILVRQIQAGDVAAAMGNWQSPEFKGNEYKLPKVVKALAEKRDARNAKRIVDTMKTGYVSEALIYLASAQARAGDIPAALATARGFRDSILNFQEIWPALLAVARELLAVGDKRAARAIAYEVLKSASKQLREKGVPSGVIDRTLDVARVLAEVGDMDGARKAIALAVRSVPNIEGQQATLYRGYAYRNAVAVYAAIGNPAKARETMAKVNPKVAFIKSEALAEMALVAVEQGDLDGAVKIARELVGSDYVYGKRDGARAYLAAARSLFLAGNTAEAEKLSLEAIEPLGLTDPSPMIMIAKARARMGDIKGVLETFQHEKFKYYRNSYDHSMSLLLVMVAHARADDVGMITEALIKQLDEVRALKKTGARAAALAMFATVLARLERIAPNASVSR